MARTGQKYEPGVGIRYDVVLDLCGKDNRVNMMSGTWLVRSTRSERRGCHRVSSEVFLANNGPVKNMNKEFCGLVRCFHVASKTSPGSSSPEISSVRQSRVEREHDVTQRQVLQVNGSAQGAARRDRQFQTEHAEYGKIRTQCNGCSACARQSEKTRRKDEVTRHSIRSLDTAEGSQIAMRRYLQLWLTKHITTFQKTSRRKEAAYHTKYRHCERFEIQQVAVRTDTVKPGRVIRNRNRRLESTKTWLREAGLYSRIQMNRLEGIPDETLTSTVESR